MINNEDLFDALADERRRQLLVALLEQNLQFIPDLSESSQEIATANERLLSKHLVSSRTIDGVDEDRLRLYHVHLPKLADYGFIEWDRELHLVTKGPRFDEMKPILELLNDHRDESLREAPLVPGHGKR